MPQQLLLVLETSIHELFIMYVLVLAYMAWRSGAQPRKQKRVQKAPAVWQPELSHELSWNSSLLYLSNGRQIPAPHAAYYWVLLEMEADMPLHPGTIWYSYDRCFETMYEGQKAGVATVELADLKAARNYLMHRYMLIGNEN